MAWCTSDYWLTLKWYQATILWLLFLDIAGGIVANLSIGTNDYYNANPKKRWIFIAVNMQPLILAVVLQSTFSIAVGVWGYTIVSASIVNMLRRKTYHRLLASGLFAAAIIGYILLEISLPLPITLVYLLYMMKLIVCFAVEYPGDNASAVDN